MGNRSKNAVFTWWLRIQTLHLSFLNPVSSSYIWLNPKGQFKRKSRLDLKLLLFNHYHDLQPTQNIGVTRIGRYLSRSTASGIDQILLFTSITTAVQPSVSGAAQTRQIKSRFCSSELIWACFLRHTTVLMQFYCFSGTKLLHYCLRWNIYISKVSVMKLSCFSQTILS